MPAHLIACSAPGPPDPSPATRRTGTPQTFLPARPAQPAVPLDDAALDASGAPHPMDPRTTTGSPADRPGRAAARRRPPGRRPGLYLGVAAAGAVLLNVLIGADPAAHAEVEPTAQVSVAEQLGLTGSSSPSAGEPDLAPLEELAANRSTREAEQTAAQQVQAAADQATLDRQKAEADAAAAAAAEAAAVAAAEAAAQQEAAEAAEAAERTGGDRSGAGAGEEEVVAAAASVAASVIAKISNTSGSVRPQVQAAADAVVSNVPGADEITLGGTRPSATDPNGHPSGLALDYMVLTDAALGDAIVAYHVAHWSELGVDYLIWEQRMLSSPGGSWQMMENRGGVTANHFDHVHVNYQG